MMKIRVLAVMVAAAIVGIGVFVWSTRTVPGFPPAVEEALAKADQLELTGLEPAIKGPQRDTDPRERMYGYVAQGRAKLTPEQAQIARDAFRAAVGQGRADSYYSCFEPRHALSFTSGGHRYDLVLCYECHRVRMYEDGEYLGQVPAGGSPRVLNGLLQSVKIPLAQGQTENELVAREKADRAKAARQEVDRRRWLAAMPAPIRAIWSDKDWESNGRGAEMTDFRDVLKKGMTAAPDRIAALFGWLGAGEGPWTNTPSYEEIPSQMLLDYATPELTAVAARTDLSPGQLTGAARLFASFVFQQMRPGDTAALPLAVKSKLLAHAQQSGDPTQEAAAKKAFLP